MPPESFVIDADKVLARLGQWPHFHDMEVVSLRLDRGSSEGPSIEFVVFVWNHTGRIDPKGHYEQTLHSLIRFRCEHVTANHFEDFNHQNVLDGLEFSREEEDGDESIKVRLPSIFGLGGSLSCGRVRVIDVVPADELGRPLDSAGRDAGH